MEKQREMKEVTREYFDRTAKEYASGHDGKFVRCMYDEIIRRVMERPGEKILDLGCEKGERPGGAEAGNAPRRVFNRMMRWSNYRSFAFTGLIPSDARTASGTSPA